MKRCDNCARAIVPDKKRETTPVKCTLHNWWVEYDYNCEDWTEKEDDGFITHLGKGEKWVKQ